MQRKSEPHGIICLRSNSILILELLMLIMFTTTSCCHNKQLIVQESVNSCDSNPLLTGLLEYYRQTHYSLPTDYSVFYGFLKDYKFNEEKEFSELEYFTGIDILKEFSPHRIESVFYKDSAFVLVRHPNKLESGSIIRDSQFYRMEHPEKYLLDEPGFWLDFRTVAFAKNGKYLFRSKFNYGALDSSIVAIQNKHCNKVTDTGYVLVSDNGVLDKKLLFMEQPVRVIVRYDARSHLLSVVSRTPSPHIPVPDACNEYLQEVKDTLEQVVMKDPRIDGLIIPLFLCY